VLDREAPAVNENFTPKSTEYTEQRQQKLALALAIQAAKADDLPGGKPKEIPRRTLLQNRSLISSRGPV